TISTLFPSTTLFRSPREARILLLHLRPAWQKDRQAPSDFQRPQTGSLPSRNEDRLQSLREQYGLLRPCRRRIILLRMVRHPQPGPRSRLRSYLLDNLHPIEHRTLYPLRLRDRRRDSRILLHTSIHESRVPKATVI